MNVFVLIFLMLIDGELQLGVKVDDNEKIRYFKSAEDCEREKLKAHTELKEQTKMSFETYCITKRDYDKLVPQKGVSS